jgi:hypothetical protein
MKAMKKSFILYSEIDAGEKPLDCVYLMRGECRAQPFVDSDKEYYKPNDEDRAKFCNRRYFRGCPRFQAYQTHIAALGLKKLST